MDYIAAACTFIRNNLVSIRGQSVINCKTPFEIMTKLETDGASKRPTNIMRLNEEVQSVKFNLKQS
jgi:hypothetical protein